VSYTLAEAKSLTAIAYPVATLRYYWGLIRSAFTEELSKKALAEHTSVWHALLVWRLWNVLATSPWPLYWYRSTV